MNGKNLTYMANHSRQYKMTSIVDIYDRTKSKKQYIEGASPYRLQDIVQ